MSRRTGAAALLLTAAAVCGCGRTVSPSPGHRATPATAASLPLITSAATGQATWAVIPMGAAAGPNEFWQLFLLATGQPRWSLATPPGIATNGAIALAGLTGPALVTGIHPSLYLTYSPVSSTTNAGKSWTAGPPAPALAAVPDSLAATPGATHLITLDRAGQIQAVNGPGASWPTLASTRSLATAPAARGCRLTRLTAVAYTPTGVPLAAGACARPGVAGIFARQDGSWQAAGPSLPAALVRQNVTVLRLATTGAGETAILQAGLGQAASLTVAWATRPGHWISSPSLPLAGSTVTATSFGAGGPAAVVLADGRAATLTGPGGTWQSTPTLPPGRARVLTQPPGGGLQALIATGAHLTVWRLQPATGGWSKEQAITVPIQYGSSG